MWTALFYANYLILSYFQQWNLGHFPKSSIDSKLEFLCWSYASTFFPINKEIFEFLNVALAGLLNFFQFKNFLNISLVALPDFSQYTKELRNWDFWSPNDFILLDYEDSLSDTVCSLKREGTQFMIKLPFFKEKKCSYLNNNSLSV